MDSVWPPLICCFGNILGWAAMLENSRSSPKLKPAISKISLKYILLKASTSFSLSDRTERSVKVGSKPNRKMADSKINVGDV
jgi:hypothetical protein